MRLLLLILCFPALMSAQDFDRFTVLQKRVGDFTHRMELEPVADGWRVVVHADISLDEISKTLEKAPCHLRVHSTESEVMVFPIGDRDLAFDLVITLLSGDYSFYFYVLLPRSG